MSIDVCAVSVANNGFSNTIAGVSYAGDGPIASVGVALSSFFASFGTSTDHEVKTISGYGEMASIYPGAVTSPLTGTMQDDSGHQASVALSIAFPAQLGDA
jgi:hypothetical protein